MQLSTSAGKHCGRFGSDVSDKLPSPGWIPFWSEALSEVSACITEVSSAVTAPLLPFTIAGTPGSDFTIP